MTGYVSLVRAKRLAELPISIEDVIDRVLHTPWLLNGLIHDYLKEVRMTYEHFNRIWSDLPAIAKEVKDGLVRKELVESTSNGHPLTICKLYGLVKDAKPASESSVDVKRLLQYTQSRLWDEQRRPLADAVNLEHAKYVTTRVEQELLARERMVAPEWNSLQKELQETGWDEPAVLARKAALDAFANKESYFVPNDRAVAIERKKPLLDLMSGTNHSWISPEKVKRCYDFMQGFIPISELRTNEQFLADLDVLSREFTQDLVPFWYGEPAKPLTTVFDEPQIRAMLQDDGLVQRLLIERVAKLRHDLPLYRAARVRRQAFASAVRLLAEEHLKLYNQPGSNITFRQTVSDRWHDQYLAAVLQRIRHDQDICKLVNGQAAGKPGRGYRGKFRPYLTRDYWKQELTLETLTTWVDNAHGNKYHVCHALEGSTLEIDFWHEVKRRLDEQHALDVKHRGCTPEYCPVNAPLRAADPDRKYFCTGGKVIISEDEYQRRYPAAIERLQKVFNDELLAFTARITPAPARSG